MSYKPEIVPYWLGPVLANKIQTAIDMVKNMPVEITTARMIIYYGWER